LGAAKLDTAAGGRLCAGDGAVPSKRGEGCGRPTAGEVGFGTGDRVVGLRLGEFGVEVTGRNCCLPCSAVGPTADAPVRRKLGVALEEE